MIPLKIRKKTVFTFSTLINILGLIPMVGVLLLALLLFTNLVRWQFALDDPNQWKAVSGQITEAYVDQDFSIESSLPDDEFPTYASNHKLKVPLLNKITELLEVENTGFDHTIYEKKGAPINEYVYHPTVQYSYTVGHQEFVNNTISSINKSYYNASEAEQFMMQNNYSKGHSVTVYYYQSNPSKAVLQLHPYKSTKGLMIGTFMFIVVLSFIVVLYLKKVVIKEFRNKHNHP